MKNRERLRLLLEEVCAEKLFGASPSEDDRAIASEAAAAVYPLLERFAAESEPRWTLDGAPWERVERLARLMVATLDKEALMRGKARLLDEIKEIVAHHRFGKPYESLTPAQRSSANERADEIIGALPTLAHHMMGQRIETLNATERASLVHHLLRNEPKHATPTRMITDDDHNAHNPLIDGGECRIDEV